MKYKVTYWEYLQQYNKLPVFQLDVSSSDEFHLLPEHTCLMSCLSGLPVQVRDTALKLQDEMPKSDVNKEYYTQNMEREVTF